MKNAILFSAIFLLTACAEHYEWHRTYCHILKGRIVFNAATNITREQEIDHAEKPLQQHEYDIECDDM